MEHSGARSGGLFEDLKHVSLFICWVARANGKVKERKGDHC